MEQEIMDGATDGLKLEPLGKYSIYVSPDHTFGTDAVLLADFAGRRRVQNACDFGTGCGIIPLLLLKNGVCSRVCGVEIQPAAADMARRSARLNSLEDRFEVFNLDIRGAEKTLPAGEFGLVTCNPPYKADGAGVKNPGEPKRIARHETLLELDDVTAAARRLLRYGGSLCVCQRPERLADVICSMRGAGLEPKTFREVIQREGGSPWLVLVEGRLGGRRGMTVMPPLYVESGGVLSDEMMEIYGDYKQGKGRGV